MLICSTTWTTEVQNTLHLRTSSKRKRSKTDVQNLENILKIPFLAILVFFTSIFFGTMRLFIENFWIAPKCPLSFVSIFCNRLEGKNLIGPSFHFSALWHCSKISFFDFSDFFSVSKGLPSFFYILQQTGVSKSPKGPPFTLLKKRCAFWVLGIAATSAFSACYSCQIVSIPNSCHLYIQKHCIN